MSSIAVIISDLRDSRAQLLKLIDGLSQRELTEIPIYPDWTIKDVLTHIAGWDRRVVGALPLMLQNRAGEIPGVEVESHNRQSVEAWRDKSLAAVLAEAESVFQQILNILASIDHVEIDRRRRRNGRVITIRSYVIDVMMEHQQRHIVEIEQWRKELEQAIEPEAIKEALAQNRARLVATWAGMPEADLLDKAAEGTWSVKDIVGHLADWEARMLGAARHIYDPSLPVVPPLSDHDDTDAWNEILATKRAAHAWSEALQYLHETRQALDDFVARLKPGDWKLRGPYPWLNDQGSLAELLNHIAEHDLDHLPALEKWRAARGL